MKFNRSARRSLKMYNNLFNVQDYVSDMLARALAKSQQLPI